MDDVETLDESSGKTMRLSIDRDIADPVDGLHEPIASLDPRSIYNYGHLPFCRITIIPLEAGRNGH